jgi:hypothetical protein
MHEDKKYMIGGMITGLRGIIKMEIRRNTTQLLQNGVFLQMLKFKGIFMN